MELWDFYTLVLVIWFFTAILGWPLLDLFWVKTGKLPPVSGCTLTEIRRIRQKGLFFRYSAFKRYKKYKGNQKQSVWVVLREYKEDMSIN